MVSKYVCIGLFIYRQLQLLKRSQESPFTRSVCVAASAKRTNGISLKSSVCVPLDLHIHIYKYIHDLLGIISVTYIMLSRCVWTCACFCVSVLGLDAGLAQILNLGQCNRLLAL